MATNALKFFHVTTWPTSDQVSGGIYFNSTAKMIRVWSGTAWEDYGGTVTDATYANNVLTISKADGTSVTLDFSDVASASGTNTVLKNLRSDLGAAAGAVKTAYSGTNYLTAAETLVAGDKALDTQIKANADAITAEASARATGDANTLDSAKAYADAIKVNGQSQSSQAITIDGADIKLDGYAKAESSAAIATTDTVNAALGKLEYKVDAASSNALESVAAGNGISVSAKANKSQTISANIKSDEKVLAASADGLNTTLSISYNSSDRKIYLKGINDAEVSSFDASAFIKDGMLWGQKVFKAAATSQEVTITKGSASQSHTFTDLTVGNTYLAMCFSNGEATETTYSWDIIDVTSLVDVYTAGNGLQLSNGQFSIKLATGNESFLTVDANGLKLDGVQDAIDDKVAGLDVENNVSDASHGVTIEVDETDGKVSKPIVTVTPGSVADGNTSVVTGGAVYTAVNTEKTRAEGVEGTLTNLTTDAKGNLVAAINEVDAHADTNASDIDALEALHADATSGKKTVATEVSEGIAGIASHAESNTAGSDVVVTVTTAAGSVSAVAVDDTVLRGVVDAKVASVSKGTDGSYFTTTIGGTATAPTVAGAVTVQEVSSASASAKGLAEASDVKGYVDGKIEALDHTSTGAAGSYIQKVSETDGVISETVVAFDTTLDATSDTNAPTDKAVATYVSGEIAKLDATVGQAAGADGVVLSATEVDGKLTAISGSLCWSAW